MKIIVTGAAGLIGFHLCRRLLADGHEVLGIDNFNDYYNPSLKEARAAILLAAQPPTISHHFQILHIDLAEKRALKQAFMEFEPQIVVNLAAQAGVRYSIQNPDVYIQSNVVGFLNVLECCRYLKTKPTLLFASSSSVYGGNKDIPFKETDRVDAPISLYAA